jgi:hypothetical protein
MWCESCKRVHTYAEVRMLPPLAAADEGNRYLEEPNLESEGFDSVVSDYESEESAPPSASEFAPAPTAAPGAEDDEVEQQVRSMLRS